MDKASGALRSAGGIPASLYGCSQAVTRGATCGSQMCACLQTRPCLSPCPVQLCIWRRVYVHRRRRLGMRVSRRRSSGGIGRESGNE